LKRKRLHRPSPQLFDPHVVKAAFNISPVPKGDHIWHFKGSIFDHGLLRKKIKPGSALTDVLVPSDVGILFVLTKHPLCQDVRDAYPPLEWDFSPNDKVVVVSGSHEGQKAIVMAVERRTLEVELSTGEVTSIDWSDVQKDISIGNFIKVLHGSYSGETGWVEKVDGGTIYVVQKDGNKNDRDSVKASLPFFNQC
jgi:transcription elongation factor